jgi:hypothetical protein
MNPTMRVVLGIGVIVVAIVLLVVLKDGGDDKSSDTTTAARTNGGDSNPAQPAITTIVVDQNGKPVGGIAEISVSEGEEVHFKVESAVSDEVHMHGYDIGKDVKAGGSVSFDFPASLEGIFEAELESRKEQILELRVNP